MRSALLTHYVTIISPAVYSTLEPIANAILALVNNGCSGGTYLVYEWSSPRQ